MSKKKEVYHVKPLTEGKRNIISSLIEEYDIKTAEDIQEALKDLLGGFRLIIMTEANSSVKSRVLGLLLKFKTEKINSWCAV
ncbi:hypothetical protein ABGF49_04600 [Helcococcus ovis]|uniref:Uncharacterized protein n=1 Tax=Helcococcus ovis TaxID=72026 RepID=A0A4R9C4R1_9FIRM|nr:hypothetical protein [Helcococcus ovis]TFF64386.1 hypothetical protein EQF92_05880 [Helcococcus ovis]TFF67119.1 hypothetical protein EQF91_01825 [Helcococcus ovis]